MLETSAAHIAKLNDEQLRELVHWLCKAELKRREMPISSVTAGGHQLAADGGIDVRSEPPTAQGLDFIPRTPTGFQVKCEDMTASKIGEEMRPHGKLRDSIAELVAAGGAYVIVCSKGSATDKPLQRRKQAMREAIADVPGAPGAHVDFYDRTRLADWVREYPGVDLWVRRCVGEPLIGWQGFGNWTRAKVVVPYLADDTGRLISRTAGSREAMTVQRGIEELRSRLRKPGEVIRLVGLSGVGKTRFVQALFESDVVGDPLDTAIVVYADQGRSPVPSARDMVEYLGANKRRSIVIVDNCNPATHRALSAQVSKHASVLSLLTVEYDVADDEPEETHLYELTVSSDKVVEGIVSKLAPEVGDRDRGQIVLFAGGNASIALALARTLKKGETLGVLSDNELFRRLFLQNNMPDDTLLRAAEVCALVYSFDADDYEGPHSELQLLAGLVELSPLQLLRKLAELQGRDLLQRRGKWRAVLPHALANRLAEKALASLPTSMVESKFRTHERLLKSFSRRLGLLHSAEARAIAERWLQDDDFLARPGALDGLRMTIFMNIAPLAPQLTLAALEDATFGQDGDLFTAPTWPSRDLWLSLARKLAYEADAFERAARIVLRFVERDDSYDRQLASSWKELFHIVLSGTQASPGQRAAFVAKLLACGTERQTQLACDAATAMLESSHFSSSHDFHFGARPRGYGWEPHGHGDVRSWYGSTFALVIDHCHPSSPHLHSLRTAVAEQFRSLWANLEMCEEVAVLMKRLAAAGAWPEGWAAVRIVLRHDTTSMKQPQLELLSGLERFLRPTTLEERVRAYVLLPQWRHFDVADGESTPDDATEAGSTPNGLNQLKAIVEELAEEVSKNNETLTALLPELFSKVPGHQVTFGRALALATSDLKQRWFVLRDAFEKIPASDRTIYLLTGYLQGARVVDAVLAEQLLDAVLDDAVLGEYLPLLQGDLTSNRRGLRLLASLERGTVPVGRFCTIFRRHRDSLPLSTYGQLLLALAHKPDGLQPAIWSLRSEIDVRRSEVAVVEPELRALGRELLCRFKFDDTEDNFECCLPVVAAECLQGDEAADAAAMICRNFAEALQDYHCTSDGFTKLACTLFEHQPMAALDAFLGQSHTLGQSLLGRLSSKWPGCSVVHSADDGKLLEWVSKAPQTRALQLAVEMTEIVDSDEHGELTWTPVARALLEMGPDVPAVLKEFSSKFPPLSAWLGGFAGILAPYREFAERLTTGPDSVVKAWATEQLAAMDRRLESNRRIDRQVDESFE
jgi:hypothetical protein